MAGTKLRRPLGKTQSITCEEQMDFENRVVCHGLMNVDFINGLVNKFEQSMAREQFNAYNIQHMGLLTHYI